MQATLWASATFFIAAEYICRRALFQVPARILRSVRSSLAIG